MRALRRHLHHLNWGRAVAVTALLLAATTIELFFVPQRSLDRLYVLAGAGYGVILLYAVLDRWFRDQPLLGAAQIAGDMLLVSGFVVISGGALSPVSFLFALPVIVAAALWGLRGGVVAGAAGWVMYGTILAWDVVHLPPADMPPGRVLYAGFSHLLGFVLLGVLGGVLADRLSVLDSELAEQRGRLAALRAQYAEIVESIDAGLLTADEEGVITFVNRAGVRILKKQEDTLLGARVTDLFGLPAGFLREALETQRAGQRCRFERAWRRSAEEEELQLGFSISRLRDEQGNEEGWLVVFQDLSEIASLEAQIRTRERMAALGEMAAGMAHELRNPLAAISGCVQMLAGPDAPDRRGLGDVALRETERLNRIIRDFLDFARPSPFRPRPVNLIQMMEEMSRLLRKSPGFKPSHHVDVVARPGATWALADPDRLRQVFWNLAGNSLKAMPEGGRLAIEIGGYGGDRVQLSFKDQGEGMNEEALARLFQPFHGGFRDGSGLGAAIVYRIVEEHHGRVQVVSRPGKGTEVRLILPACPSLADPVPESPSAAGARA